MKRLIPVFDSAIFGCDQIDFTNEMLEANDLFVNLKAQALDISSDLTKIKSARSSLENLIALRSTIKKHGISKSIMEVADPHNELVDAGICVSYESLSDCPLHDSNAADAIEKLDASIEGFSDTIKRFVASIGNKIKDFKLSLRKMFGIYRGALERIYGQLKHTSIDEELFLDMNVKALDKNAFNNTLNAFIELFNTFSADRFEQIKELVIKNKFNMSLNSFNDFVKAVTDFFTPIIGNDNIKNYLGIALTISANSAGIISPKIYSLRVPYREIRTTSEVLNWSGADIIPAIELFMSAEDSIDKLESVTDSLMELAINIHAQYDQVVVVDTDENTATVENVRRANYFIDSVEKITDTIIKITSATYKYQSMIGVSLLELARAAVASKA